MIKTEIFWNLKKQSQDQTKSFKNTGVKIRTRAFRIKNQIILLNSCIDADDYIFSFFLNFLFLVTSYRIWQQTQLYYNLQLHRASQKQGNESNDAYSTTCWLTLACMWATGVIILQGIECSLHSSCCCCEKHNVDPNLAYLNKMLEPCSFQQMSSFGSKIFCKCRIMQEVGGQNNQLKLISKSCILCHMSYPFWMWGVVLKSLSIAGSLDWQTIGLYTSCEPDATVWMVLVDTYSSQ